MADTREEIVKVEVLDSSKLRLVVRSGGQASYQHVYREASGVYWDSEAGAFVSTERKQWSYAMWFTHIVEVCARIGVVLRLAADVRWNNVSGSDQQEIISSQQNLGC